MMGEDNTDYSVVNLLFTTIPAVHYFEPAVKNAIARLLTNAGHQRLKQCLLSRNCGGDSSRQKVFIVGPETSKCSINIIVTHKIFICPCLLTNAP